MKNKGFTLPELMIGMAIMSIIVALTFPAYTDLLSFTKGETASEEAQLDKIIGLELIRLDLENAAYGIARDEKNLPVSLTGATATERTLQLNSTLNNTNPATIGWIIYNCSDAGSRLRSSVMTDNRQEPQNSKIVLLDHNKKNPKIVSATKDNCPDEGVFIAFPYDGTASPNTNACTAKQFCTSVSYHLSAGNTLSTCAAGTRNLLRAVGGGAGDPVINCVADFFVTFGLDVNEDGDLDDDNDKLRATALPDTTEEILRQVKIINIYILMQEGVRDNDLNNTNADLYNSDDVALSLANVTEDPGKFRWKVVRISGKPMSM